MVPFRNCVLKAAPNGALDSRELIVHPARGALDFQISIAPNRVLSGFRFGVPISTSAVGDHQKTTPKIVSLVEASATTEEEAHETS
jgi:hypothetical protein